MEELTKMCPNCGTKNSSLRVTCEECHTPFAAKDLDKIRKRFSKLNAQLMTAKEKKQPTKMIVNEIAMEIKKSGGKFVSDSEGYAKEISVDQPEPGATTGLGVMSTKKHKRTCPCCGEPVGGYFKQGHDGRIHGVLLKLDDGSIQIDQQNETVQRMFKIWSKNKELTMKQLAMKLPTQQGGDIIK